MAYLFASPLMATALAGFLQTAEGSVGIPWWVWFVLIGVLLLLLLIGFARQSEPGEPLPEPGERVPSPAAVAVAAESSEEEAPETTAEIVEEETAPESEVDSEATAPVEQASEDEAAPADDLKRIEGIGPKISAILSENGIITFAALAATETDRLQEILDAAGIRLAHPGTWPEQAALAAAGKWDELEKLQDNLKAGRKD